MWMSNRPRFVFGRIFVEGEQRINEIALINVLNDVNDDPEVRKLIHNMMEMNGGTMMKNILSVCIGQFGERYFGMKVNDWRHLIDDYVRKITERPDLEEDTIFNYKAG
jgi:type I restriction enzyme R subunit